MFQLLEKQIKRKNTIFDDVVLQSAIEGLAIHGVKPKSKFSLGRRAELEDVLKEVNISVDTLDTVKNKQQELQEDAANLSADISLQDELITESEKMISESEESYMAAIIDNDDYVVKQMREKITQYNNNIEHAEIRSSAYLARREGIQKSLKRIATIQRHNKKGLQIIRVKEASEEYQVHLQQFIKQFKAYKHEVDVLGYSYIGDKKAVDKRLVNEIILGVDLGHVF